MNDHVTKTEFNKAIKEIKEELEDIRDNHLPSIYSLIDGLLTKFDMLKWVFIAGMAVLGIVLGLLQVFG